MTPTPSERLKNIEEHNRDCAHMEHSYESVNWLISRVRQLEEALTFYTNGWVERPILTKKSNSTGAYTHVVLRNNIVNEDHGEVARKALECDPTETKE